MRKLEGNDNKNFPLNQIEAIQIFDEGLSLETAWQSLLVVGERPVNSE